MATSTERAVGPRVLQQDLLHSLVPRARTSRWSSMQDSSDGLKTFFRKAPEKQTDVELARCGFSSGCQGAEAAQMNERVARWTFSVLLRCS